tara:strand:+ start:65 stop:199 length:135 start_codon:yes stop_codon:yes gene_type:complete
MEGNKILIGAGIIVAIILIAKKMNENSSIIDETKSNASGCGCGK